MSFTRFRVGGLFVRAAPDACTPSVVPPAVPNDRRARSAASSGLICPVIRLNCSPANPVVRELVGGWWEWRSIDSNGDCDFSADLP